MLDPKIMIIMYPVAIDHPVSSKNIVSESNYNASLLCGPSCKLRLARISVMLNLQDGPSVEIIGRKMPVLLICAVSR